MSRNRSHVRTVARVEVLEQRQLMAELLIHLGPLAGKALVDFHHGLTPATDRWTNLNSLNWVSGPGGRVSSFEISIPPIIRGLRAGEHFVEVEVALRANGMLAEEIDFKSVTLVNASITTPGGDDLPEESVTFAFDQYTLIPKPE
jgi:hypothetical protein